MPNRNRPNPRTEMGARNEFWRARLKANRSETLPHDHAKRDEDT